MGLEVACVDAGGWDTHEKQGGADGPLTDMITDFGAGLAAFYADMQRCLDRVTVATMSEFGRRGEREPRERPRARQRHVRDGQRGVGGVHTRWPDLHTDAPGDGQIAVTTDYHDVLAEILNKRLGNGALGRVFLDHTPTLGDVLVPRRFA